MKSASVIRGGVLVGLIDGRTNQCFSSCVKTSRKEVRERERVGEYIPGKERGRKLLSKQEILAEEWPRKLEKKGWKKGRLV